MKTTKLKDLQKQHEFVCNEYVKKFCNKQEIVFDYWVESIVGEVAVFGDYFINLSDIVLDVNTKQPKGEIFKWYNDNLMSFDTINYYAYTKGVRIIDLK